ncbi:uncharacterized protein AMSG_01485 [Thecamonas trahens ATCC 50062]|uniref:Uncharacterized protein n=1 Tax=Thecamonas trahens ATCC 50062 TaxID=461836 RepID=A0A0L0DRK3_THETB|nr:hypothetical protein AMSG_01485 [Thecamonas trahens ATCC 50062]KNC54631.1 hypothetical protein AMSG_01485 [Thecamonas trahens ATCC 50062]|eukprot:XP_013761538.1 hypothetical protein AMSG_01485 [Thecamonas trahens ATCC 50062]
MIARMGTGLVVVVLLALVAGAAGRSVGEPLHPSWPSVGFSAPYTYTVTGKDGTNATTEGFMQYAFAAGSNGWAMRMKTAEVGVCAVYAGALDMDPATADCTLLMLGSHAFPVPNAVFLMVDSHCCLINNTGNVANTWLDGFDYAGSQEWDGVPADVWTMQANQLNYYVMAANATSIEDSIAVGIFQPFHMMEFHDFTVGPQPADAFSTPDMCTLRKCPGGIMSPFDRH